MRQMLAKQILILFGLVLVNGALANLVWRIAGADQRRVQLMGKTLAVLFALANLVIGFLSLAYVWRNGWSWFYAVVMIQAFVFAFRFGGATTGSYP